VRKIADEHRALDKLFTRALTQLVVGSCELQTQDAFEELREALESHLAAEENLYFPTIWALRPEFKERLRAFIRAHHYFRGLIQEITGLMDSHESEEAKHVLERLRHEFRRHEVGEEDALISLDQQILIDESH
jgi:iron-sulfur cluster repair protein YtfE (RIC family)